ncbi:LPXTG cell wall anchor domain-containing protein [Brevibacterium gallinarum]|uniref:LPXTG cell wall anchor domain-containing protein n=1 Tax=Brevibacterium gallinarum TaxID=2762220 RepID=A0ABR8WW16_9MICO|nr:LPXTG cell wall anchor domain-containing protein [Brevibacterium gallinarum]MBD8021286.1 LPXTG cell wall anchor domain-containing protein [Brevibacterium gallinarum]
MAEAPAETATPAADEAERKDGDTDPAVSDPQVTLSAAKATDITLTDKNSGIRVMVTGIKQDATVTDSLLNKTHTSTGDSLSYIMYSPKSPSAFSIGDTVTVTFTQGDKTVTRTKTIEVIETRDGDGDDTGAPGGDAHKDEKAADKKNSGSKTDRSQADTSKADGSHTQGAGAGLPRTGVELTALLAAAGLLAVGTAVVAFTRRTKKQ